MTERYLISGPYRLDTRDERLWIDEEPVHLGGKPFALLRVLMEHPEVLLTKSDLFDFVWPGVAVSESVLTTAIKELRQGLGDDARKPTVIQTVHRRGYRFMLPVEERSEAEWADDTAQALSATTGEVETSSEGGIHWPQGRSTLYMAIAAIVGVCLLAIFVGVKSFAPVTLASVSAAHPKSIAVLPFDNLSSEADDAWFAVGLTEEVLDRLTRVPDLQVASHLSSLELLRSEKSLPDAAKAVGVAHVLEGSVRRANGRVRVTAQLVRAEDGFQLWSQSYDRASDDVISIQEDIAFEIASALKTVMDPTKLNAMVKVGTRSVEAYESYLRGVAYDRRQMDEGGIDSLNAAVDAYERAREIDPNFAAAHWNAALTWYGSATRINSNQRHLGASDAERREQFRIRVDAAIATSQDETETLRYLAARSQLEFKLLTAHELVASYLEQRPRDIDAWDQYADISAYVGERGELARAAERIHTLSIEIGDPQSRAITLYVQAMMPAEAVARAREQLALRPDAATTLYQAHRAFLWNGDIQEARETLVKVLASNMLEENHLLASLRQACAEQDIEQARVLRARLDQIGDVTTRWIVAQTMGEPAVANELLRPLDTPDELSQLVQYMIYPTFDSRVYPVLTAALTQIGVNPPPAVAMPNACKPH